MSNQQMDIVIPIITQITLNQFARWAHVASGKEPIKSVDVPIDVPAMLLHDFGYEIQGDYILGHEDAYVAQFKDGQWQAFYPVTLDQPEDDQTLADDIGPSEAIEWFR